MRYLNSGEVSKTPTALRTAKYSCLGAWEKRSADRYPDQWVNRCWSLSSVRRSWNGVVRIMVARSSRMFDSLFNGGPQLTRDQ